MAARAIGDDAVTLGGAGAIVEAPVTIRRLPVTDRGTGDQPRPGKARQSPALQPYQIGRAHV
jgi:hypothetical protein